MPSCCQSNLKESHLEEAFHVAEADTLSCWAVVDRHGVVLWDTSGVPRRFCLSSGSRASCKQQQQQQTLCFGSHNSPNVDDLLTPCLDEEGRHGVPEEECFCGEEEPHLHAHWHHPSHCENLSSSSSSKHVEVERLANVMLMPQTQEHQEDALLSPSLEHPDLPCQNILNHVKREGPTTLVWRQKPCDDCTTTTTMTNKNNVQATLTAPAFCLMGTRTWNVASTRRPLQVHFFRVGHQVPIHDGDAGQHVVGHESSQLAQLSSTSCASKCCGTESKKDCKSSSACCSSSETDKCCSSKRVMDTCCSQNDGEKKNCCSIQASKMENNAVYEAASSPCCGRKANSSNVSGQACQEDVSQCAPSPKHDIDPDTCNGHPQRQISPSCCAEQSTLKDCCSPQSSSCCKSDTNVSSCCRDETRKPCCAQEANKPNQNSCCPGEEENRSRGKDNISSCCKNKKGCCASKDDTLPMYESVPSGPGVESTGRSQFHVRTLCCASEVSIIKGILDGIAGIQKVAVNPTTKTVFVNHETSAISAAEIMGKLNRRGLGAELQVDAAECVGQHRQSLFVVSKFKLGVDDKTNTIDKDRLDLLLKSYDGTQVESYFFEERAGLFTVIHNPWTIDTSELLSALKNDTTIAHVDVIVNGSDQNREPLDFESLAAIKSVRKEDTSSTSRDSRWPRPTVVVSGILWIVSMLSFIGEKWEFLKYVALASVAFGLPPIARKAFGTLRQQFRFDANGLMFIASIGALALGEFPEAGAVVFLFALSEWLEQRATTKARQALSAIVHLRPDKARMIDPETQQLWDVPANAVPVGSLVSVKTGDKIPCDGIVVEGQSTVDESSLTGESRPIRKCPKDSVSGGTVNNGVRQLVVRTTATADDSAVARLIRLVEEAQLNRSDTEKRIDEFAKFYTPLILCGAILMCSIPWLYGPDTGRKWTHNGLVLVVVACPCALIISTPVTYVAGLAATAQKGILIKGGAFLEALGQVSHICFDKTGTLTNGEFGLLYMDIVGEAYTREEVLQHLLLMEERAAHPVAQAIINAARNENITIPKEMVLQKHTILAGEGVTGVINDNDVFIGNERLFDRLGLLSDLNSDILERVNSWKHFGGTIGFISIGEAGIVGMYCAADAVRPEAANVVSSFQKGGIRLSMLTGDNEEAANSVGTQLGWQREKNEIHAKLLPADKLSYVEELTTSSAALAKPCYRKYIVLFVGDGVNDAPALAAAHIGVAMGSGATVAMETAHVTLLDPSLRKLEFARNMGIRVLRKIIENVVFSVTVKAAVLVWALTGSPGLWVAIGSDVGSMLLVTLNSMRLLPSRSNHAQKSVSSLNPEKVA